MIRQVLGLVRVACLFIWPPDIYVRTRVDHAGADLLAEREAEVEVMEPIRLGPVIEPVSSGHPVEELVEYHHVDRITGDGIYCACHHRSKSFHQHAKHVAGFVLAMVEADVRIAASTNRFQK